MPYTENPKTAGSGIACCIPQRGRCPRGCADCFFQSGRSYLKPLDERTPNMPTVEEVAGRVVRVNDGNDSDWQRNLVARETARYPRRFYNTAGSDPGGFDGPVVVTVNPGEMTDERFSRFDPVPPNLMFVRFRANTWNLALARRAVDHYVSRGVPVVLTFMAYHEVESIPARRRGHYRHRRRTLNSYWAIRHEAWCDVMELFDDEPLAHSCGTEDAPGGSLCRNCGNCLREYHATVERMRTGVRS